MIAYKAAIRRILAEGWSISVFDGEEWDEDCIKSRDYDKIVDGVSATGEAQLRVRDADGTYLGTVAVMEPGPGTVSDKESVIDWSWSEDKPQLDELLNQLTEDLFL